MLKKFNLSIVAILYFLIIIFIKLILNLINIEFMTWFYHLSHLIIYLLFLINIIQYISQEKIKYTILILVFFIIITFFLMGIELLFSNPTHIIIKDNEKMEVSVFYWDKLITIDYYKYINPFMRSYNSINCEIISTDSLTLEKNLAENNYDPFECDIRYQKYKKNAITHIFSKYYINILENIYSKII